MIGSVTRKGRVLGLAAALGVAATVGGAPAAHASDAHPCTKSDTLTINVNGRTVREQGYSCPLRTDIARIPVRFTNKQSSPIVGYLDSAQRGRFKPVFAFEAPGGRTFVNGDTNFNWASVRVPDTGRWGWVNEVYFAGGGDDEDEDALVIAGGASSCAVCGPLPWRVPPPFRPSPRL